MAHCDKTREDQRADIGWIGRHCVCDRAKRGKVEDESHLSLSHALFFINYFLNFFFPIYYVKTKREFRSSVLFFYFFIYLNHNYKIYIHIY